MQVIEYNPKEKWIPSEGFVPNETTAGIVAEAVLVPIYGSDIIKEQMPFIIELVGDSLWVVKGIQDDLSIGGVVSISILKSNCTIIEVSHGE